MKYIDMHCDTIVECFLKNEQLRKNTMHIDAERLKNNMEAQFFAVFIPSEETEEKGIDEYAFFKDVYRFYQEQMMLNSDYIKPVLSYDDLEKNMADNITSSILTIEDGHLLKNRLSRVKEVYDMGVRLITLTWDHENCIGYPNSSDSERHMKGLKEFGIQVVEEMSRLGMIIDVSHLSEGGFYDVIRHSCKPIVASHSCARALCNHSRNLTDDQLRAIAECGGTVGVNFYSKLLREQSDESTLNNIVRHIKHMVSVMGVESVSLGADFDGFECKLEIGDYSKFDLLLRELQKNFTEDQIEKICRKNVMRVMKECL